MRRPTFGRRFDADFAESLKEDIEIAETDTAEQKALKQAVIDTKAELSARMKAGEKPSDIMNDFTGSLYELGQYRRTIEEELTRLKKDETISDNDIVDFVGAANQMLTEKGAKPIQMPKMIFRHISLKRAAAKRAQEQQVQEKNK
jgi:ABC-type glycerol-3-phosphate transport system substrate-binding protein